MLLRMVSNSGRSPSAEAFAQLVRGASSFGARSVPSKFVVTNSFVAKSLVANSSVAMTTDADRRLVVPTFSLHSAQKTGAAERRPLPTSGEHLNGRPVLNYSTDCVRFYSNLGRRRGRAA